MKIKLKNKILEIRIIKIYKEPGIGALKKELSEFFEENKINEIMIKDFEIEGTQNPKIIPKEPYVEERLSYGDYVEKIRKIGEKYQIENLDFASFCYHK